MNPVPVMKLVELIRGIATDERPSKRPRFVTGSASSRGDEDLPAFVVNRVLVPMINEAIYTLYEGVGTVEASTAMKLAPTIRWGRCNWRISSGSIPACRSCRCCTKAWRTRSTARARCW